MKIISIFACVLVALDCAEKATGVEPQSLISPDYIGVWWVMAAYWAVAACWIAFDRRLTR